MRYRDVRNSFPLYDTIRDSGVEARQIHQALKGSTNHVLAWGYHDFTAVEDRTSQQLGRE
jgi:hypothetical protein